MLIDEIKSCVSNLKRLDMFETAAQDIEKKKKNDNEYSDMINDLKNVLMNLSEAKEKVGFQISEDTILIIEEGIQKSEKTIENDVVDEIELISTKQHLSKKIKTPITKEWKLFYNNITPDLNAKLSSMGGLLKDTEQIKNIKEKIKNGSEWTELFKSENGTTKKIKDFSDGIMQVDQLEHGLNLNDEIKEFVMKVSSGKARITDINQNIIDWINTEGLVDKFIIKFKRT